MLIHTTEFNQGDSKIIVRVHANSESREATKSIKDATKVFLQHVAATKARNKQKV